MSTEAGRTGQKCLGWQVGSVKSVYSSGWDWSSTLCLQKRLGLVKSVYSSGWDEYLQKWVGLVNNVDRSRWDWSRMSAEMGVTGQECLPKWSG